MLASIVDRRESVTGLLPATVTATTLKSARAQATGAAPGTALGPGASAAGEEPGVRFNEVNDIPRRLATRRGTTHTQEDTQEH